MAIAEINWNEGRYGAARASAAMARPLLEQRLQERPAGTGRMKELMRAYAYLGRCADAVRLRERVRAADREDSGSVEVAGDRFDIALRCGDYAEAVALADTLIRRDRRTVARFRVQPAYAPLRGRPDFERLIAEK
jgi:hypothetical protein